MLGVLFTHADQRSRRNPNLSSPNSIAQRMINPIALEARPSLRAYGKILLPVEAVRSDVNTHTALRIPLGRSLRYLEKRSDPRFWTKPVVG